MEEAIAGVTLNLNLLSSGVALQVGVQEDMLTNNRDQAHHLANVQHSSSPAHHWTQDRAAKVEALRLSIASGTYRIDSAELAQCIARNSTRFLESC